MESMTGYAAIESRTNQFSFSISVKTLNSRYLEIITNIPRVLKSEEIEITNVAKKYINRGKFEINIEINDWEKSREVEVNTDLLKKYLKQMETVEKLANGDKQFSLDTMLSFDGVLQREKTVISEASKNIILNECDKVLKKLIKMRKKEGDSVKKDMLKSLSGINKSVTEIKKLSKEVSIQKYKQLKERLESIMQEKIDDVRLYSEIAIMADKLDINEEISRLTDHMKKFKKLVTEKGQIGKKIDFIAQEMFREINTITSKSNSSKISHISVDVKNFIDKIREQSRNVV